MESNQGPRRSALLRRAQQNNESCRVLRRGSHRHRLAYCIAIISFNVAATKGHSGWQRTVATTGATMASKTSFVLGRTVRRCIPPSSLPNVDSLAWWLVAGRRRVMLHRLSWHSMQPPLGGSRRHSCDGLTRSGGRTQYMQCGRMQGGCTISCT